MSSNAFKISSLVVATAIAGAFALANTADAQTPSFKAEKCYGIAKAGKNDCQTANSSCAGTSKRDAQGDAWVYVPEGTCVKLVGASLEKKG
jgi:uncharacterized membrane protein